MLRVYTDGACSNNGYANAVAGCGVYFEGRPDVPRQVSKLCKYVNDDGKKTNMVAEMVAVYYALKRIYFYYSEPIKVHFYIDNQNALNTLLKTRTAGANFHIIKKINHVKSVLIKKGFIITGEWVEGHSTSKGNNMADKLARSTVYNGFDR